VAVTTPVVLLVALAIGAAGGASTASDNPPPVQSTDAFCASVPATANPFVDDDGSTFEAEIECLAESGITTGGPSGLPPNRYGPQLAVTRGQMASFIAREIDTANTLEAGEGVAELAPYDGSNAFSDVADGNVHLAAINRLARVGITAGGPDGRPAHEFGPNLPVTRAQMASFVNRGHALLTGGPLVTTADYFTDDDGDIHEPNINGIASEGIAVGDSVATYRPRAHVTRGQMAAFLIRHLADLEVVGPGPAPPPVTVRFSDGSTLDLVAFTYCYRNTCADGMPPADPPDVGSPEELVIEFPLKGWSFTALFRPAGDACGRVQEVPLTATGEGQFMLRPAGYAGIYDVTLFGQGNGDLFTTFRWATPTDGPLPEPEARLAVVTGLDGQIHSYGVELEVRNLARTPDEARAVITVRAENGEAVTFEATRARRTCLPEGTVYWDGPDDQGLAAAALGEGPFAYEVELVLDGDRYVGTATWPADLIDGYEPSVALDFTPELPALSKQ